jgi:RNA polymerase sigma-70 factor, ECF subfamily
MAAIRRHVMALPERQRMAVLMHKYQGMDYRQIGDVLEAERIGNQVAALSRLPDVAGKTEGFCLNESGNMPEFRPADCGVKKSWNR